MSRARLNKKDHNTPLPFISLEEAAAMKKGVRLHVVRGQYAIVAVWIQELLNLRGVDVLYVNHDSGKYEEIFRLTSQTSLPVLWVDDERPYSAFLEQVFRINRLGSGPSLIPTSSADRVLMFGLMNEIQGEDGLTWNARNFKFPGTAFGTKYGWSEEAVIRAPSRMIEIMGILHAQLEAQKAAGSRFFIGNSLTALDVHWAVSSNSIVPGGVNIMQQTERAVGLMAMFANAQTPELDAAFTPLLREHREFIYNEFLGPTQLE